MEDIQSIIHGTFGYLGALVSGVIVTIITTKWINKEVVLTKRFFVQRTATLEILLVVINSFRNSGSVCFGLK